jgi:hypothetical protein
MVTHERDVASRLQRVAGSTGACETPAANRAAPFSVLTILDASLPPPEAALSTLADALRDGLSRLARAV